MNWKKWFGREKKQSVDLEELVQTSVTLGYEADRWGTERIALDGVQNHLPADSKGTKVDVDFLVDGKWVSRTNYREDQQVEAVRFSDDGVGYSHEMLGIFHSTKKGNEDAVGYFGEGLKMLSAACLREGIDLELRSRDWQARPRAIDLQIDDQEIQRLAYEVKSGDKIKGSQSIFWNPSDELVDYVHNLDRRVLHLREGFQPLYETGKRAILDEDGDVFVKGIYISSLFKDRLLFSYGLDVTPNRDRDDIRESVLVDELTKIWSSCDTTAPIKALLETAERDPEHFSTTHEAYVLKRSADRFGKEAWQSAFAELYGENAVLQTQKNVEQIVESLGHKVVLVKSPLLRKALRTLGVTADIETMETGDNLLYQSELFDPNSIRRDVRFTSLTLDYRASNWGALRIALDALGNHMPEDAGGSEVVIEYLMTTRDDKGNEKKEWKTKLGYYDNNPEAIRIRDDGRGYSLDNLLLLHSSKSGDAVGQFGEGLKMLSAACLRSKTPVKFRSRDWIAMPLAKKVEVSGDDVEQLGYTVAEGADQADGSSTTFFNPSYDLVGVFKNLGQYVLHFNDNVKSLHESEAGRIVRVGDRKTTYVKGFYIADNNSPEFQTLFSYDLQTSDITPDRNIVDHNTFRTGIKKLLRTNTNSDVVKTILGAASRNSGNYVEFMDLDLETAVADVWKASFEEQFGSRTVLDSEDPSCNYEAEHAGYNIVYFDKKLMSTLRKAGVRTARHVAFENYDTKEVSEEDLTDTERENLALIPKIDGVLGIERPVEVEIYDDMKDSTGMDPGISGFWRGPGKVYLRRSVLATPYETVRVYTHERGHNETEAPDPADAFRHFFESNLTGFVVRELGERGTPIEVNPVAFDYALALKDTRRAIGQYNAAAEDLTIQQKSLAEAEANAEGKLRDGYESRIGELSTEIDRLRTELRSERSTPWYKRIFR